MILRIDRLQTEMPPPSDPDPEGAARVQELMGGRFGELSTLMNYTFQSFNFRHRQGARPFYDLVEPLSWALIRITVGLMIIPHGWPKLMMGIDATAQMALVKRGIQPAEPLAVVLITLETLGGLCVALGLFTRFWAAAITIALPSADGARPSPTMGGPGAYSEM